MINKRRLDGWEDRWMDGRTDAWGNKMIQEHVKTLFWVSLDLKPSHMLTWLVKPTGNLPLPPSALTYFLKVLWSQCYSRLHFSFKATLPFALPVTQPKIIWVGIATTSGGTITSSEKPVSPSTERPNPSRSKHPGSSQCDCPQGMSWAEMFISLKGHPNPSSSHLIL